MKAKKLIYEDSKGAESLHRDLKAIEPLLKEMYRGYKNLEMGEFDNKIFDLIKSKGSDAFKSKYFGNIDKQLKKMGVTSSVIKQNLTNGSSMIFDKFASSVRAVKSFNGYNRQFNDNTPTLNLDMIDFIAGWFRITEETEVEFIEQHCKVYLQTDQEHKIFDAANKFMDGFKDLMSELDEVKFQGNDQRGNKSLSDIVNYFFSSNGNDYVLKPHSIKAAIQQNITYQERVKEFADRGARRSQVDKERQERFK